MNKAAAVAIAGAVGLTAIGAGAFAWTGGTALDELKKQSARITEISPAFKVVDEKVERGLFHSTHTMKVRFGCMPALPKGAPSGATLPMQPGEPIELSLRTDVRHGPMLPTGFGFAAFDTVVVVPEKAKQRVDKLTSGKPPLRVQSTIGFDRTFKSELTVPALQFEDANAGSLATQALHMHVRGDAWDASRGGHYTLEIPGFSLHTRAPDATIDVESGAMKSEMEIGPRKDASLWLVNDSKTKGTLNELIFAGSAAAFPGGPPKVFKMSFPKLTFEGDSKLEQGSYNASAKYAGAGKFNEFTIDKVEVAGGMRRLDAKTYQKLAQQALEVFFSCDEKAREGGIEKHFPAFERDAVSLLMRDPEYGIDMLAVEIGGKRAELSYSFGTRGVTAADSQRALLELALEHGIIRAHAKLELALLDAIDKQLNPGAPPDQPGMLRTLADVGLSQLEPAGYFTRSGDVIETQVEYAKGTLMVNGQTPALPDLNSLLPGP